MPLPTPVHLLALLRNWCQLSSIKALHKMLAHLLLGKRDPAHILPKCCMVRKYYTEHTTVHMHSQFAAVLVSL